MKHGLMAVAVLMGGTVLMVHAEYVRFVYNPGVVKKQAEMKAAAAQGQGQLQGGPMGRGGPAGRGMGGMQMGRGGGAPAPGGPGGPGIGGPGGPGGPGIGGPAGGGLGSPDGGGIGGVDGGGPGGMGEFGMGQVETEDLDLTAVRRDIVVEVSSLKRRWLQLQNQPQFDHKWGRTGLYVDGDIQAHAVIENRKPFTSVKFRYESKRKEKATKKNLSAEEILDFAEYALTHGLQDKFDFEMSELVKNHPKHAAAVAYEKYEKDFKRPNIKDDTLTTWSERLGTFKVAKSDHYLVRFDGGAGSNADHAQEYLKQLESNYKAFFSWFALRGQYFPVPDHRLVVILSDNPDDFQSIHKAFDLQPLPADGFLSRRDNLALMSARPLDEAYEHLNKDSNELWVSQQFDRAELLKGVIPTAKRRDPTGVRKAMTISLLLKAMEEKAEVEAITHVGSRQLAAAIGLLPRTLASPEWIQFGTGSLFEIPMESYWNGTGAPHWVYLMKFKIWKEQKKLDRPEDALKKVVTDEMFRASDNGHNKDMLLKARTMAWSLTYFLAQKKFDGLLKYYAELSNLPRDMELDHEAMMNCFVRAFDLADPAKPEEYNTDRFKKLAREWYENTNDAQIEVAEVMNLAKKAEEIRVKKLEAENAPKKPAPKQGSPGQRGGFGGPAGPGGGKPTGGGGGPAGQ